MTKEQTEMDWIDEEKQRRDSGQKRALLPSQHEAVNKRYPGCTWEYCCSCNQPTGRARRGEDSIYTEEGQGAFCLECWKTYNNKTKPIKETKGC